MPNSTWDLASSRTSADAGPAKATTATSSTSTRSSMGGRFTIVTRPTRRNMFRVALRLGWVEQWTYHESPQWGDGFVRHRGPYSETRPPVCVTTLRAETRAPIIRTGSGRMPRRAACRFGPFKFLEGRGGAGEGIHGSSNRRRYLLVARFASEGSR